RTALDHANWRTSTTTWQIAAYQTLARECPFAALFVRSSRRSPRNGSRMDFGMKKEIRSSQGTTGTGRGSGSTFLGVPISTGITTSRLTECGWEVSTVPAAKMVGGGASTLPAPTMGGGGMVNIMEACAAALRHERSEV